MSLCFFCSVCIHWSLKLTLLFPHYASPYLVWLSFATVLNWAVVRRNPTVNGYNDARFQADLLKLRKKAALYADGK